MEPAQIVFRLTDGQETWAYTDLDSALEHIRQGVMDKAEPGDEYHLELALMTESEIAALPVQ